MEIGFLFPGQGSQFLGMGKEFRQTYSIAKDTYQEAEEFLSLPLSQIIDEGPETLLMETRFSQLAIYVNSVAILRALRQQLPNILPNVCAGLSLGEYTAIYASGRLEFLDTLALIRKRSELMNKACLETKGAMSAVLGLSDAEVEAVVRPLSSQGVWIANFNCPGQAVISGTVEGVFLASELLRSQGAKKIIPLSVHGAFHSGLMHSAQTHLASSIESCPLQKGSSDLIMNVPGTYVEVLQEIKKFLTLQVSHPVRWSQGILAMKEKGVSFFIEFGAKSLSAMNKKIDRSLICVSLTQPSDLELLDNQLKSWKEEMCRC